MREKIVILGASESGVGAALLGIQKGYDIFVSDHNVIKSEYRSELINAGIDFEQRGHNLENILDAHLIIKSPGIPESAGVIQKIRENRISLISEVEWASRFTTALQVAITGSNGKSTTTSLFHHIMEIDGKDSALVGNIGFSFARQVAQEDKSIYAVEVSSFQLDDIDQFSPKVAILTNITKDHLNRYDYSFDRYRDCKFKITSNQSSSDYFIYCMDDLNTREYLEDFQVKAAMWPISLNNHVRTGAHAIESGKSFSIVVDGNPQLTIEVSSMKLKGKHNIYNAMAAASAAFIIGVKNESIIHGLISFKGLEHRMEYVGELNGIEFINDSKATNADSVWFALDAIEKPIVWIAGGVDKGNDYSSLMPLVDKKVKSIICLGSDNTKLTEAFEGTGLIKAEVQSIEASIAKAIEFGESGDVVLLSPACASFDLFQNFVDRGNQFKSVVSTKIEKSEKTIA